MNYKSPIELMVSQMNVAFENEVYKAVQNAGVIVDKDELIKALKYDRNQYEKGYADRDSEIVRCKDCVHWDDHIEECSNSDSVCFRNGWTKPDWFCADGERIECR